MFNTDDKGQRSRKAYREGAEASKSSGFWGHVFHEFEDAFKPFFPQSAESKAHDAGWHDYSDKKYRYNRRKRNNHSSQPSSNSGESGIVALIVIAVVIGGVVWLGSTPIKRYQANQEIWTMRRVKAVKLNIRSAPGVQSPVVAEFEQGGRIAVTGEPVKEGNSLWIRVSSDDSKIQGWANQSYIDYGPYDQDVETATTSQAKSAAPASASTSPSDKPVKETPHEQGTGSKPEMKVSSNMRVVTDEPQNSATPAPTTPAKPTIALPSNARIISDEPPSDGIPRLMRRTPDPSSEDMPRLKRRNPQLHPMMPYHALKGETIRRARTIR